MSYKLVKNIYSKISKLKWETLPFGFKNGKVGLALFLALYSEKFRHHYARCLSEKIFESIVNEKDVFSDSICDGKLGLAWVLSYLNKKT